MIAGETDHEQITLLQENGHQVHWPTRPSLSLPTPREAYTTVAEQFYEYLEIPHLTETGFYMLAGCIRCGDATLLQAFYGLPGPLERWRVWYSYDLPLDVCYSLHLELPIGIYPPNTPLPPCIPFVG